MRCVSVSVIKNEADVIEAMVRHNTQFLDFMTFFDNGSVDGTLEILHALRDEGLPIDVRQDLRMGHPQTRIINSFVRSADCDRTAYVFALDADEFISCDLADFRAFIATAPGSFLMLWKTYVPTEGDDPDAPHVLSRITHCRRREPSRGSSFKAVLSPLNIGHIRFRNGNHSLDKAEATAAPNIRLAHFPVRSAEQLACKVLLGSWNIALRGRLGDEALQWFRIADKIRQGGMPTASDLTTFAASYAAPRRFHIVPDPLLSPRLFSLRYSYMAKSPLLSGLIQFTDDLIAQLRGRPNHVSPNLAQDDAPSG